MRVAAILGLASPARHLQPFARFSDALWQMGLPANPNEADAILVFGGDGTVHRHLPQLVKLQLPVLVVPHGSGNDFARALHLRSAGDALAAWRQFVSGRGSVRQVDLGIIAAVSPDAGGAPAPHGPAPHAVRPDATLVVLAGWGLMSRSRAAPTAFPRALRRRGGYLLSLLPALSGFHPLG